MRNPISCISHARQNLVQLPHTLLKAFLGLAGTTPEFFKESLPGHLNNFLTESENLFNRCAERGEIILEKRRA